jgi:hypothetical protein
MATCLFNSDAAWHILDNQRFSLVPVFGKSVRHAPVFALLDQLDSDDFLAFDKFSL